MRRLVLPLSILLLVASWLTWRYAYRENAQSVAIEHAQSLENALQAVEWYTNESVNKALRAEAAKDFVNARLFGDKAIESDLKAKTLRSDTADAWQAAGQPARARAAWSRAANMAGARARMLADRIPLLYQQWVDVKNSQPMLQAEREIEYFQSLFYTAEQWALVVQFASAAEDADQVAAGKLALRQTLQTMVQERLLEQLAGEPRLMESMVKVRQWQQMLLPTQH